MQVANEDSIYLLMPASKLNGIRFSAVFGGEAITVDGINRFVGMEILLLVHLDASTYN